MRVKALADEIGSQVIQNKREAARQGLEIDMDLYGQLCEYFSVIIPGEGC
jgi:hypothetical protein